MKKLILGLFVVISTTPAFAVCPSLNLPARFNMEEKGARGDGRDFKMKAQGQTLGIISMRNPTARFNFELKNERRELIARAYEADRGNDVRLEVVDCENRLIGIIKARAWRNSFHLDKQYKIYDGFEREVGTATKNELMATQYNVVNLAGQRTMEINNPALDLFGDSWKITLHSNEIDPRIALILPAYKTSSDVRSEVLEEREERREEREERREDRRERREREKKREKEERRERERRERNRR